MLSVLFTVALISMSLGTIFSVTLSNARMTKRTADRAVAVAFGDGVIESLYDQWRQAMISVTTNTDRQSGLTNASLATKLTNPTTSQITPPSGISLVSWSVVAGTPYMTPVNSPTVGTDRPTAENGTSSKFRVRLTYIATATVSFPGRAGNNTVTVQRTFVRSGRPIFDNFFFGTQPNTEFHPGAPMYVTGSVYAAGNLYTAHDDLHFLSDVGFLGDQILNYRTNDPRYGDAPTITPDGLDDNWDSNNPPRKGAEQKLLDTPVDSLDPNFMDDPTSNDYDSTGNSDDDGYHEIIEEQVNSATDPLELDTSTSERLSENSDYRVYVDASNNVTIYKGASATALLTSNSQYIAIKGALTLNTAIRDVRDGDNVRLVNMDIGVIKSQYDAGVVKDNVGGNDGLVIFVKDTSAGTSVSSQVVNSATGAATGVTSSRSRGVRLKNGAKLPSAGLTVVSPNPVYIQGDYNTGLTSSAQPPSNTATSYTPPTDTPSPEATGYDRVPAAVAADAVNVLSNNWNDANSLLSQSSRIASNTTINTAVLSGNVPTTTSSYSGGIENFMRLHENWSGKYFTVYGTLGLLFASNQATHPWSAADYSAPNRRWYYDENLRDVNPPGFHVARVYERGTWTLR